MILCDRVRGLQMGVQSPWPLAPGFPLPYQVRDKLRGNDTRSQVLAAYVCNRQRARIPHCCQTPPLEREMYNAEALALGLLNIQPVSAIHREGKNYASCVTSQRRPFYLEAKLKSWIRNCPRGACGRDHPALCCPSVCTSVSSRHSRRSSWATPLLDCGRCRCISPARA